MTSPYRSEKVANEAHCQTAMPQAILTSLGGVGWTEGRCRSCGLHFWDWSSGPVVQCGRAMKSCHVMPQVTSQPRQPASFPALHPAQRATAAAALAVSKRWARYDGGWKLVRVQ